jgi:UDPglucose--hexose-1-phosphate uridylyltransferase
VDCAARRLLADRRARLGCADAQRPSPSRSPSSPRRATCRRSSCSRVSDLRRDPLTGRWAAIAPARAARPGAAAPVDDERASCPFCAGHEERTPPEELRLGDGPTGWAVRVVPNLYPALERQEVVVHGPEHARSLADVPESTVTLVADAWRRRAREVGGTMFALVNEGRAAGSSLPHAHSQLAWLPGPPPAVTAERGFGHGVTVVERGGLRLSAAAAPRQAYELAIAPAEPEPDAYRSILLGPALLLVAEAIRRLRTVLDLELVALNAWVHDGPHWHIELLPRLTTMASLELGAGVSIATVAPEDAAERLQAAAP